ncbi:MAG: RrF2 family transcriptional regulator [Planctomycetaceae bacterium]
MFTQTVEYALRAMICLASNAAPGQTVEQISRATQVPAAYLGKVLQQLVKQHLVTSRRGAGGGFSLALPPDQISLLRVVQAVDPIERITTCPLGLEAHGVRLCPLHKRVDNALADMERAFAQSTLAEILAEPTDSIPLCNFPPRATLPCQAVPPPR